MSLIRACRGISIPSAAVKGLSGSGLSGAREHKERPLTALQPQMLLSEADTLRCRLLPCGEQFPLGGGRGEYGSRDWSLVPCRGQSRLGEHWERSDLCEGKALVKKLVILLGHFSEYNC